ncbi:hypothetical protein GF338_03790 [candidate division WOR-3 bacterium]|nr:hypothetical protein [candidate division WOR-3 bacterium]
MKAVRLKPKPYFSLLNIPVSGNRGKTALRCPICSKEHILTRRDFKKAHLALNQESVFDKDTRELFRLAFPLQKIDSNVLGKRMSIYLEYALDRHCKRCRFPLRVLFAIIEGHDDSLFYLVKAVLTVEEEGKDIA